MAEPNVLPLTLLRNRGTGARHSGMVVASVWLWAWLRCVRGVCKCGSSQGWGLPPSLTAEFRVGSMA